MADSNIKLWSHGTRVADCCDEKGPCCVSAASHLPPSGRREMAHLRGMSKRRFECGKMAEWVPDYLVGLFRIPNSVRITGIGMIIEKDIGATFSLVRESGIALPDPVYSSVVDYNGGECPVAVPGEGITEGFGALPDGVCSQVQNLWYSDADPLSYNDMWDELQLKVDSVPADGITEIPYVKVYMTFDHLVPCPCC